VAINCGAIPENLLESELFGHTKGAFTDAYRPKKGLFEEADGGTLFLDEVGELPLMLQVKLLRALQEEEIRRVGDTKPIKVDVRIIAATVRDLETDVRNGKFRGDLFYRLNVLPLYLPLLRERKGDVPLLVDHFLKRWSERLQKPVVTTDKEAMEKLLAYHWPGNVRELENAIERAIVLAEGDRIGVSDLPPAIRQSGEVWASEVAQDFEISIKKATRMLEERLIRRALQQTAGNRTQAAKLLEISHRALLYKIKEYNIGD
jgi:two-component system response regulator AtoC